MFWLLVLLLLSVWTMLALPVCNGLCPTRLTSRPNCSSSLRMVAGDIAKARQRDREAKTLYDYLGASPKDSQAQLKIRYTELAKKLHPDSNPDGDISSYYDLSEINAAWEVLKDPAERKRYDRSLQTKEITESIESSVGKGLEFFATNAIPFLQKTAVTTAAAISKTAEAAEATMDASQKAAKEVEEQAKKSYTAFETEQQIKSLEQKANAESTKAKKIQKEMIALPTTKIASLEKKSISPLQAKKQTQQQTLSSSEAQKIIKNFQASASTMKNPPVQLSNDIKVLTDTENKQNDAAKELQSTERAIQMAERQVQQAVRAEKMAQKKLEEAQKALKEAQLSASKAQEFDRKARLDERTAQQNSAKIETALQTTRERVRLGLSKQQDAYLTCRTNELKKEKLEREKASEIYLNQAKELKAKAKKDR
mmetsp:Transcript_15929/g.39975  ORF Transcript_15929/g.39975 Transcript_15929/m.39975 type:complete len:425 (-) Transcript_15929:92-1366(-)